MKGDRVPTTRARPVTEMTMYCWVSSNLVLGIANTIITGQPGAFKRRIWSGKRTCKAREEISKRPRWRLYLYRRDRCLDSTHPIHDERVGSCSCWSISFFIHAMLINGRLRLIRTRVSTSTNNPPHTQTFDPANRKSSLLTRKRSESSRSTGTEVPSETSTLAALSGIINSIASLVHPGNPPLPSTPKKNQPDDHHTLKPSPSQLGRFLTHAEKEAGVKNASRHEYTLAGEGYGPDILHLVDDKALCALGIPAGDVLRLKQAVLLWWKAEPGRALKRRHEVLEGSPAEKLQETPPNKKMRFEKRYVKGGSWTLFGPTMEGDVDPNADFTWYFYSKDLKMTLLLPRGLVPILDGEEDNGLWPSH